MKKTILITGSSSGIGKAAASLFAGLGWNVIATMRNPDQETELTQLENIFVTKLDVQRKETIEKAIQDGIQKFGQIDVLVNNAGYGEFGLFEASTEEQVSTQFEINVFGVMNTIRAILPHFRERKKGTIINVSSGAGKFTLPLISLYSSSKFALEGFSEALSFELSALNIGVKIIEPGGTATNFSKVSSEKASAKKILPEYDSFVRAAGKMFGALRDMKLATAGEVAHVIYTAATDGTSTLRYVVGNEDFIRRVAARASMPDQEYIESVKKSYLRFMDSN